MLYRKISKKIEEHLLNESNRMLIVDGARQVGKSYIIRAVGSRLYRNFIEINMEEDKMRDRIFSEAKTVKDFYISLSIIAGNRLDKKENTLIFIDEIQSYDHLLTLAKFLMQDGRYTFIASGSQLGVTLKRTQSIPIGYVSIEHMYPMDFEEFLIANGVGDILIEELRSQFIKRESPKEGLHNLLMDYFRKYLIVGGLPDAVNTFVNSGNIMRVRDIQREIHSLYGLDAAKYEKENNRKLKIQRIYSMIPSVLSNKKKRIVVKDIEDKDWKRYIDYADEFEYLISSGISLEVRAVSKPSYPLIENTGKNLLKLYLNDVGILTSILYKNNITSILNDEECINLGSVYETVVAQELRAHGYELNYYDNKKIGEVDFIIDDNKTMSNVPIEVKSGKDYTIHSALNRFLSIGEYNIHQAFVLNNSRDVVLSNGVTYLPIYYIMFF